MRRVVLLAPLLLGGCEALLDLPDPTLASDGAENPGDDAGNDAATDAPLAPSDGSPDSAFDADPYSPDAPLADASPPGPGQHLWLTEVVLSNSDAELIEIYNPTNQPVLLDDYYLADVNDYFKLPAAAQNVAVYDFIVRFPAGHTIQPATTVVVAVSTPSHYATAYGTLPDFSVNGQSADVPQMLNIDMPAESNLSNGGECISLFRWDGQSDRVGDVDLVNAGNATLTNALIAKTGFTLDGPDPGNTTSTYLLDVLTMGNFAQTPNPTMVARVVAETSHELQNGTGNGITGDDETSESIHDTWAVETVASPGATPF